MDPIPALKYAALALVVATAIAAVVIVWNRQADDLDESKDQMRSETVESLEGG